MDFIYSLLQIIGDAVASVLTFIIMIPSYVRELFDYAALWLFEVWIETKLFMLKLSLNMARELLTDYGVYDLIEVFFNRLPPDVRFVLTAYGVPEGLRMLFDAYATSFVLRVVRW